MENSHASRNDWLFSAMCIANLQNQNIPRSHCKTLFNGNRPWLPRTFFHLYHSLSFFRVFFLLFEKFVLCLCIILLNWIQLSHWKWFFCYHKIDWMVEEWWRHCPLYNSFHMNDVNTRHDDRQILVEIINYSENVFCSWKSSNLSPSHRNRYPSKWQLYNQNIP